MRYRFGRFELAVETRELLADGEPRAVEPQVFDLLLLLVEQRDRVVSQDDLIGTIWKGRIVSDAAISARISAARTAIDDSGSRQEWIRTVPRRGFRFVGAVEVARGASTASVLPAPAAGQRIGFCRSRDGTRIAHATSGSGPLLVRVGTWLTHLEHDWQSPVWRPFLDRLSRSFQLLRYDQRGNGLSDWDIDTDITLDLLVDDLTAVVDAAGAERFTLYGASQGAPIAIAFARRHPGRVERLILHGGYEQGRLVRMSEAEREQATAMLTLMRHGWGKPGSAFIESFATLFIPDGSREQIDSLASLQRLTIAPEMAVALRAALDRVDVSGIVGDIACPTLVVHARGDNVQPLDQGRALATRIAGAEFVMLDSRNHVIVPQEPAWPVLFAALERFVGSA